MPRYLIEEPNPFADAQEWLYFREALVRLPADDPDVAAALRHADEALAALGFDRTADPNRHRDLSAFVQMAG
ncbi:hypothetical protein GCM10007856_24890 [Azospirillum oryzae]|nr:hypothetical protein GCM10007856_24890 [Azospirillum oryzae]